MLQANTFSKVTPSHLKKHNESLVLREIYAHETISRVRLAELTHLSRPSITELTQGLIERGLIAEVGAEMISEKVGKKARLLALNPDAYQMIGVVLKDSTIIGSLLNLRMDIQAQCSVSMQNTPSDERIQRIIEVIERIQEQAQYPLLGITIGTPGIVDSREGIIHLAASYGWRDYPLTKLLSQHFDIPIYIGNDSNLAAIGENRFGVGKGVNDLVVVEIGTGIGVGILADGHTIEGSTYAAGELGHTPFPSLEDECLCGRHGCLETVVSWWGIQRQAQRIAQQNPDSVLNQLAKNGQITTDDILQAVALNDPDTLRLVERAANYLGHALLVMTHLLNPKLIILTGSLLDLGDYFVEHVRRTIYAHTLPYISNQIEIKVNRSDAHSILFGAGAFLLEQELGL